jgi:hypothetical protein
MTKNKKNGMRKKMSFLNRKSMISFCVYRLSSHYRGGLSPRHTSSEEV